MKHLSKQQEVELPLKTAQHYTDLSVANGIVCNHFIQLEKCLRTSNTALQRVDNTLSYIRLIV